MRENGVLYGFLRRIISTYVSFVMTFVSVIAVFLSPMQAYAETLSDNPPDGVVDFIGQNDTMENNWGLVKNNEGTIVNNMGTAGEIATEGNPGGSGGTITNNYGTANNATVSDNYGNVIGTSTVTDNWASGTVGAGGSVGTNHHGTDDEHKNDGLIEGVNVSTYAAWSSGPNPVAPVYNALVSESEDAPVLQISEDNENVSSDRGTTEQIFINTINNAIINSESGSSVIIDMGNTSSFSAAMVQALCMASEKGMTVLMNMNVNGRNCQLVIPGNAYLDLLALYFNTMDSFCEGYELLLNLIPGATLVYTDESGNSIVIRNSVTDTDIQNVISKANKELNALTSVINTDDVTYLPAPVLSDQTSVPVIPGILGVDTSASPAEPTEIQKSFEMQDKALTTMQKKKDKDKKIHVTSVDSEALLDDLPVNEGGFIDWWWYTIIFLLGENGKKMYVDYLDKLNTVNAASDDMIMGLR